MLTLRIEPFWVDEKKKILSVKKFFLGEKISKNFLLRIFANWSMEIPKMQKKKFEKKNLKTTFFEKISKFFSKFYLGKIFKMVKFRF